MENYIDQETEKTNDFTQKERAPKRQSRIFLMRMLVVFLDRTVPASRKANPPCRVKIMQLLMRTKKVSMVSFISCSVSTPGVDWVEVEVVRLARTVVVVVVIASVMVVIRFVGICSVLEKISVVPSIISVDIFSCSVANISSINSVTFSSNPAMFLSRVLDLN